MNRNLTRRGVLLRGLQLPLSGGLLLGLAACGDGGDTGKSAVVCADPGSMSSAEESVRRTLHYTETSPDPSRTCAGCVFFSATPNGACGTCEIFSGKAANPGGHCDSWSVDS